LPKTSSVSGLWYDGQRDALFALTERDQTAQAPLHRVVQRGAQRSKVWRVAHAQLAPQQLQRVRGVEFAARHMVGVQHVRLVGQQQHAVVDLVEHQCEPRRGRVRGGGRGVVARSGVRRAGGRSGGRGGLQQVEHRSFSASFTAARCSSA
jgi:uncharacterized membrane protein YgcG